MLNDKAQSSNECQMTKSKVQIWHLSAIGGWHLDFDILNHRALFLSIGRKESDERFRKGDERVGAAPQQG
jgi:hypothetical protein